MQRFVPMNVYSMDTTNMDNMTNNERVADGILSPFKSNILKGKYWLKKSSFKTNKINTIKATYMLREKKTIVIFHKFSEV